ncbi:hypothetical protein [Sphingomonas sp. SAFR-052]|uniref:hypothetical protein n=1 Tax=Sphingomonas sp. SAFR-052 TaxID=3436867 RepID=UPI003F815850
MFGNDHLDRVQQSFADQFSDAGHDFIYRKSQKGPPIRVTRQERDLFVAQFGKTIRYTMWAVIPATFGLILLLAWLTPSADSPSADYGVWIGVAAILLPLVTIMLVAWTAPSRHLRDRTPEGSPLSRGEARELAFSKISYLQLAGGVVVGILFASEFVTASEPLEGHQLIKAVFGTLLLPLAVVQTVRKWLESRR